MREGYKPCTTLCKNADGQITSNPVEIKSIWKTYFQNLVGTDLEKR